MYSVIVVIVLISVGNCQDNVTVDYFETIITQNIAASINYTFPTKYEEFEQGAQSQNVIDFEEEYDFIIIGAGSAGGVLATRLSEVRFWKILLIEAGKEEALFNRIPAMALYAQFSPYNWGFYSTPQRNSCLGMINQSCIEPRGKGIGGSSAINAVMYIRGNPEDYNKWSKVGCPEWTYSNVLKYFKKSENFQADGDSGFHGYGGLLDVQWARPPANTLYNFIGANKELHQKFVDYNGCEQLGVSRMQITTKRGFRQSTGTAFLDYGRERSNLRVITEALVTKITINETTKIANGVIFVKNNKKYRVKANLEVIVSGGAISSPQILMLSGIGPKEQLSQVGIEEIMNLPVGKNLIEHPVFQGVVFNTNSSKIEAIRDQIQQLLRGGGSFTTPIGAEGLSFTHVDNFSQPAPDIEHLYIKLGSEALKPLFGRVYNYNENLTNNFINNIKYPYAALNYLVLLHPESRGRITLKSQNPIDMPNIDLNMFDKPNDIRRMVIAIRRALKLLDTKAFRQINATLMDIPICQTYPKFSDQYWECMIRHMASTLYHPAGTCSMGPNPAVAVVDCEFKVHGIKKLRVIDASVIPVTISGHLNAPTIMLAEKASDMIKRYYNVENANTLQCQFPN